MNGMLRVPRTRGVLSGLLLVLLGAWGALVPFVGPYFHYAYTPDTTWSYTSGRLWLEILPGAGTLLGGLIVLLSAYRPVAQFGAWLAAVSGAWFALGSILGPTWSGIHMNPGTPAGGPTMRALEQTGFFTGLGVVVVLLAAMALGRFSVISVRDARRAERAAPPTPPAESTVPARARGTRWTLPLHPASLPRGRRGRDPSRPGRHPLLKSAGIVSSSPRLAGFPAPLPLPAARLGANESPSGRPSAGRRVTDRRRPDGPHAAW